MSFTSIRSVFQASIPPSTPRKAVLETIVRPPSSNYYIRVNSRRLWDASLLDAFGESCRKVLFQNSYHILLCHRRIIVVDKEQQPFSFPPFSACINDAHIEKVSNRCLLVLVSLSEGVYTALLCHEDKQYFIKKERYTLTSTSVARTHRLGKTLFALCYANCFVQPFLVEASSDQLDVLLLKNGYSWLTMASNIFWRKSYKDSFFDPHSGNMMVLSDRDVSLWTHVGETELRVQCTMVVKHDAVAIFPSNTRNDIAGIIVFRSGERVPLVTRQICRKLFGGLSVRSVSALEPGEIVKLPPSVNTISVSHACSGANTIVLYDELTLSLVVIVQNVTPLPMHVPASFQADVVSQINLNEKACSIGFEPHLGSVDRGVFWVYGEYTAMMGLNRVSLSKLLRKQYLNLHPETEKLLNTLHPEYRSELLLEAAIEGLSLEKMAACLNTLLVPILEDAHTFSLSPAAIGFVNFLMHEIEKVDHLCSSFLYWELGSNINRARQRLLNSCAVLSAFLNQGGWLNEASLSQLQWTHFRAHCGRNVTQSMAINAQAQYLDTLLRASKHAGVLAWIYTLLIEAGKAEWFSGPLHQVLWEGDPEEVEIAYTMKLLACEDLRLTEKLLHEAHLLPLKVQLAIRIHSWVQQGKPEDALIAARDHVPELVRLGLFDYVCDLLEKANPEMLPRIRLLLQRCQIDATVSSALLELLDCLPPRSDALRKNLRCIFESENSTQLRDVVLDWMEQHGMDDERVETFASIIAEQHTEARFSNTLTGRFFYAWSQKMQGNYAAAARLFGDLARTGHVTLLTARHTCIEQALQCTQSDADKLTQFILLLQKQLVTLLENQLNSSSMRDPICSNTVIESDLALLRQHYLDERKLFEIAGRYRALGGASVQLDILKINPYASEEVTSDAIIGLLAFLKAVGLSAEEAVERVLHEYLTSFQGSFLIYPFVLFLAFDGKKTLDIAHILFTNDVPALAIFNALLHLIDGRTEKHLPVSDVVQSLLLAVKQVPREQHLVCAAHLQECIRGLLAGEYHAVTLTQSDIFVLKAVEADLKGIAEKHYI